MAEFHKKLPKLDLNVTNRCNFRCVHCAFDSGDVEMPELSVSQLEKILRETKELGGERIDITGGEALVREDIDEIIKLGKSFEYKIELVSNGSLLTKEKLERFRKIGLDSIAISLDGSTYNIYNKIRRVSEATYNHVLGMIDECVKIGIDTKINSVVFDSNLYDLDKITEFCIEKKVSEHGIYYFTPIGRGSRSNELAVEPVKWLKFIKEKLMKYDSKIKLSVEFPLIEKEFAKEGLGCMLKEDPYHLQILPNGNVYPCAIASYYKPIGNLYYSSVKEIWNNRRLWEEYYQGISSEVFQKFNDYCVNFSAFDLSKYDGKYKFVCPLRKFLVGELK